MTNMAWPVTRLHSMIAARLLLLMATLAGGAARRESITIDEVAHLGAGVSYLQKLGYRMNEEHPPLAKLFAAAPLVIRGVRADYSDISWSLAKAFSRRYWANGLGAIPWRCAGTILTQPCCGDARRWFC
ncbi:MAG TPA: hypothetical protein VKS44_14680 [Candidatus Acidoferrales bacterium]|nr:hypothetical protein [Candidatus Acidoferrales bacterium]